MTFDSASYFFDLLAFSVLALPAYYALPTERGRRLLLTAVGMYLTWFIAPHLVLFYVGFWSLIYFLHRTEFANAAQGFAAASLWGRLLRMFSGRVTTIVVLPLLCWKVVPEQFTYLFNTLGNAPLKLVSTKAWEIDMAWSWIGPIGLSFATFRGIDLLVKTYLGKLSKLRFDQVMFYGFFPPVQVIGPLIEYEEVQRQDGVPSAAAFLDGLVRIAVGFFKVFVIANMLQSQTAISATPPIGAAWMLWLKLIGYSFYFYLNFSGYSDIAIGIASLYGYRLKENFNFPYFRPSIREFWNNWHMGLTRWVQRNVFVPLGGYRSKTRTRALFGTIMVIALWHGISLSMVVFGLYHFGALWLHQHFSGRAPSSARSTGLARRLGQGGLTYLTVLVSLPLLQLDLAHAAVFYRALVGL